MLSPRLFPPSRILGGTYLPGLGAAAAAYNRGTMQKRVYYSSDHANTLQFTGINEYGQ